jgi:hypothetical protein
VRTIPLAPRHQPEASRSPMKASVSGVGATYLFLWLGIGEDNRNARLLELVQDPATDFIGSANSDEPGIADGMAPPGASRFRRH